MVVGGGRDVKSRRVGRMVLPTRVSEPPADYFTKDPSTQKVASSDNAGLDSEEPFRGARGRRRRFAVALWRRGRTP
jgi:hypothetical protein